MFDVTDIIIFSIGLISLILWFVIYIKSQKYISFFESLNEKEFPLKDLYSTGYYFMELIGYKYKSKSDKKRRQELTVIYGEKYTEYYMRVIYAQQVSMAFLVYLLSFVAYGLTQEIGVWIIMVIFAGVAYYYYGDVTAKKIRLRSLELSSEFCNVVSKLALLTNAGMILHEAWEYVCQDAEGEVYDEMRKAVDDMNNGVSETEAIRRFGNRCIIPEIKKFTSTIIQGLVKGNAELSIMLQNQSNEVWNEKKQNVRRQGEKASSKLLIPMLLMFVGILIMVIVPIFSNLGA